MSFTKKTDRPGTDRTKQTRTRPPVNGRGDVLKLSHKNEKDSSEYVYRVFNDKGTRIEQHKQYGWEPCTKDQVVIGTRNVVGSGDLASVTVDSTDGTQGIVMRIRKDWYDEDQKAKQDAISETEKQITGESEKDGNYGKVSIE